MSVSDAEEAVDRAVNNAGEAADRVESELGERTDRESVSTAVRYVRRAVGSGALAAASGSVSLLRGLRAVRRGDRGRGFVRLLVGALFLAFAVVQRRSAGGDGSDVGPSDVVDTGPGIEEVDTEGSAGESGRHTGEEAAAVADTSPDVEDAVAETGEETEGEPDRNASGGEAMDVVDTGPDIEEVDAEAEPDRDASDDEAAAVADTSPDVEDAVAETGEGAESEPDRNGDGATVGDTGEETETDDGDGPEAEPDAEGSDAETEEDEPDGEGEPDRDTDRATTDTEASPDDEDTGETGAEPGERTYERLGEAAFDEHGREVPAPQRAFDLNVLSLDHEAFWGIRESDDAVFVSVIYDSLGEGTRYVASSRVDEDRMLQVPDPVTDHWDEVADGGTALAGGDGLVFAVAENAAGDRLRVVPAKWADDVPGLEGTEE